MFGYLRNFCEKGKNETARFDTIERVRNINENRAM